MTVSSLRCDQETSKEAFSVMCRLQAMGLLCDLEIQTSTDHVFKVHKIVMVATCSYFQSLLLSSSLGSQVSIQDLDHTALDYAIRFIYGEEITPTDTGALYQTAKLLGIPDLIKKCKESKETNADIDDVDTSKVKKEDLMQACVKGQCDQYESSNVKFVSLETDESSESNHDVLGKLTPVCNSLDSKNRKESKRVCKTAKFDSKRQMTKKTRKSEALKNVKIKSEKYDLEEASEFLNHYKSKNNHDSQKMNNDSRTVLKKVNSEFSCDICQIPISKKELSLHKATVHEVGKTFSAELPCEKCGEIFVFKELMSEHYKQVHNKRMYICEHGNCDEMYERLRHYVKHKDFVHMQQVYKCALCPFTHKIKDSLTSHMYAVHNKNTQCQICGEVFTLRRALWRHEKSKHGIVHAEKLLKCDAKDCSYTAYTPSALKLHMVKHTKEKNFQCDVCFQKFARLQGLRSHCKLKHTDSTNCLCFKCGHHFINHGRLSMHIKTCGLEEKLLKCSKCDWRTNKKDNLERHEFSKHRIPPTSPSSKIHECAQCGYQTIKKSVLVNHMKRHANLQDHLCEECGKGFKTKSELMKHVRFHPGGKRFYCQQCPYSCTQQAFLRTHERIKHSMKGVKPYKCPYCKHCSALRENCLKHVTRIHPKEKAACLQIFDLKTGDPILPMISNYIGLRLGKEDRSKDKTAENSNRKLQNDIEECKTNGSSNLQTVNYSDINLSNYTAMPELDLPMMFETQI